MGFTTSHRSDMSSIPGRFAVTVLILWLSHGAAATPVDAAALVQKVGEALRSGTVSGLYRIQVIRPGHTRDLLCRGYYDYAGDRFRMEIIEPRKSRGTVFRKVDGRLTMFLPKLNRVIVISPAMMQAPWMGSDFTNRDLLETGSLEHDYTHTIVAEQDDKGMVVYTLESRPKPAAAVEWARLVQHIRANGIPMDVRYYDGKDRLVRTLSFHAVKDIGDRRVPTRLEMRPTEPGDEYTTMTAEELRLGEPLPESLFSEPRL